MSPNLQTLNNHNVVASNISISKNHADDLRNWLREYAKERINSRLFDERRCIPPYVFLDLGNRGIMGMQIPEQYGGLALRNQDFMRVLEQLAAIDLTLATSVSLNNTLGVRPIMNYATQEVRDELLPILARGRELAAFGMTEPEAGADIGKISTLAVPDTKGGWRLRGMKRWNGFAWAGIINIFVRLMDPTNPKQNGLTGFVVRQGTPGLRIGQESLTMGLRGIVQNSLYLEDVPVGLGDMLGEPGNGTAPADDAVVFARLGIGIIGVGGMKRCAQLMLHYATRRYTATGRLLDSPITLARLSNLTATITALEELLKLITKLLDEGHTIPREVAVIIKIAGSEYLWQAADDLVQLLGGRGYMETNIAPQILRDARVLRIGEGPNESVKIFLGKSVIHTENVNQFLREGLGAKSIADKLKEVAQQINDRCLKPDTPFSDRTSAMAWAYSLVGEVTINALLLTAVEQKAKFDSSKQLERALTWAQINFDRSLKEALAGTPSEYCLLDAQIISECVSNYTISIDDIEQTLAGEDRELDELLRQNPAQTNSPKIQFEYQPTIISKTPPQPVAPNKASSVQPVRVQSSESLQDWMVNWLVKKLKIEAKSVEPSQAFADFGIDSMLAVELSQDLSELLHLSLEATILWKFPTIESLAQHLVSELSTSSSTDLTNSQQIDQNQNNVTDISNGLDALSDMEIANLLVEEIAKSAQKK